MKRREAEKAADSFGDGFRMSTVAPNPDSPESGVPSAGSPFSGTEKSPAVRQRVFPDTWPGRSAAKGGTRAPLLDSSSRTERRNGDRIFGEMRTCPEN